MSTPLLSSVRFASFLVYAPRAKGTSAVRSRRVRDGIKNDTGGLIALAARRMRERWPMAPLEDVLGPRVLLVPAPRSAPLKDEGALWPARRVCEELVRYGHGGSWKPLLRRRWPVQKAAFAPRGERPSAEEHLVSLEFQALELIEPERVVVVDDFVTTGATLLACASHVQAAWPRVEVVTFGLVRTESDAGAELERLDVPVAGSIVLVAATGRTQRRP